MTPSGRSPGHRASQTFRQLAQVLTGRIETKKAKAGLLTPILEKLRKRA